MNSPKLPMNNAHAHSVEAKAPKAAAIQKPARRP